MIADPFTLHLLLHSHLLSCFLPFLFIIVWGKNGGRDAETQEEEWRAAGCKWAKTSLWTRQTRLDDETFYKTK